MNIQREAEAWEKRLAIRQKANEHWYYNVEPISDLTTVNALRRTYTMHPVVAYNYFRPLLCLRHISDLELSKFIASHCSLTPDRYRIPGYPKEIDGIVYSYGIRCESCEKVFNCRLSNDSVSWEIVSYAKAKYLSEGSAICPKCNSDMETIREIERDVKRKRWKERDKKALRERRQKEKAAYQLLKEMGVMS